MSTLEEGPSPKAMELEKVIFDHPTNAPALEVIDRAVLFHKLEEEGPLPEVLVDPVSGLKVYRIQVDDNRAILKVTTPAGDCSRSLEFYTSD